MRRSCFKDSRMEFTILTLISFRKKPKSMKLKKKRSMKLMRTVTLRKKRKKLSESL